MNFHFELPGILHPIVDGDIYKSPYDKRNYRHIELQNGIKVLLISDTNTNTVSQIESSEEDINFHEESNDEEYDEESDTTSTKNMASIAVCLHTGSLQDPPDIPGLAHFLEHMLFMGSEEYNDPSDFGNFISNHGGIYNAYTCMEQTNFFFSIPILFLDEALHRFCQFFISPLLLKETIEKERIAVDNEFQNAVQIDEIRANRLLQTFMYEDHPASNFINGNLISLKNNVKTYNIDLAQRVRNHYETYYSSQIMTSVVYAPVSLEKIEQKVITYLAEIPDKKAFEQPHDYIEWQNVFDPEKFNRLYRVKTIKSNKLITLSWPTPPQVEHYKTKPLLYVSFILGHEGEGTLFSYLKKKNWIYKLMAGCSCDDTLNNSYFSLFQLTMELSDEGLQNIHHIVQAAFFYIKLIRMNCSSSRIFKEISLQSYIGFMSSHLNDPCDITATIASTMKYTPPQDYLMGGEYYYHFDAKAILECLTCLKPSNLNIMLGSHDYIFPNPQFESWFKILYTHQEIPSQWLQLCHDFNEELYLPRANIFMPTHLNISPPDSLSTSIPLLVPTLANIKLYYMYDDTYQLPKCCAKYVLDYIFGKNHKMHAIMSLYCFAFQLTHQECIYEAEMAKIDFKLCILPDGKVIFEFEGIQSSIHSLVEYIFCNFIQSSPLDEITFTSYKTKLVDKMSNSIQKQQSYLKQLQLYLLKTDIKTNIDIIEDLKHVTLDEYLCFVNPFPTLSVSVSSLICGCISQQDAISLATISSCYLNVDSNRLHFLKSSYVSLPSGSCLFRTQSRQQFDTQLTVANIYQCDVMPMEQLTSVLLLEHFLNPFVFEVLRDKEQLAYEVYSQLIFSHYVPSIVICVVSDVNKNTSDYIDARIENAIIMFIKYITELSDSAFNKKVEGLIKKISQMDASLEDLADRYFNEIIIEKYMFDRRELKVKILPILTKNDVLEMAERYLDVKSIDRRKLSIQIVGENGICGVDLSSRDSENYELIIKDRDTLKETYPSELLI